MDTESLAVSAVNSALGAADYLKSYINQGEKGPSFDGYICTYSRKGYKKVDESGRAPVQVKGKEVTAAEFLRERISFPVDFPDLLAFRREGGVIFFVVLINKDNPVHKRIYYNPLLPYDLNEIIDGKESQDSISIHLKPFPDGKAMEDAVLTFASNRIKQFGIVKNDEYHNYSFEEIIKKRGITAPYSFNIGYTSIQKDEDRRPFIYFFDHDFYIYYNTDPFGNMIPMNHVSRMEMVSTDVSCSLKVGDKEYFNRCFIYFLKDRTVYGFKKVNESSENESTETLVSIQDASADGREEKQIQKSEITEIADKKFAFYAVVYEDKDDLGRHKVTYTYKITGTLRERINIEEFLLALIKKGEYSLNGKTAQWCPSEEELHAFSINGVRDNYGYLLKVQRALGAIGCEMDLACDMITDEDDLRLKCMVASILDNIAIGFQSEVPELAVYDVANLHLLLYFDKQDDGKYLIRPIPDRQIECHTEDASGIHPTSFYTVLNDKEYERLSNLDMSKVVTSICSFNDTVHFDRANGSLLMMLTAYDRCKNKGLLDAAQKIGEWLVTRKDRDTTIFEMNLYQCLKRKGELLGKHRKKIRKLVKSNQENLECLAGCYLLLDENEKAAKCIDKLPLENKRAFLSYPIMRFMN